MTHPEGGVVELRRRFAVAPHRVFAAFADPRLVARWLTPSPDVTLTVLHLDFREGGGYRFGYALPDGTTVIVGGTYRSIEPPSRIAFSWIIEPPDPHAGMDSEVTVTIVPDGAGAELTIRHEGWPRSDAVDRHAAGWQGAFDHLALLFDHGNSP